MPGLRRDEELQGDPQLIGFSLTESANLGALK